MACTGYILMRKRWWWWPTSYIGLFNASSLKQIHG